MEDRFINVNGRVLDIPSFSRISEWYRCDNLGYANCLYRSIKCEDCAISPKNIIEFLNSLGEVDDVD